MAKAARKKVWVGYALVDENGDLTTLNDFYWTVVKPPFIDRISVVAKGWKLRKVKVEAL